MFGLEHLSAAGARGRIVFFALLLALVTLVAAVEAALLGSGLPLRVAALGWAVFVVYAVLDLTLLQGLGRRVGALTVPSGAATPSVDQHSAIEALEARGDLAGAAAAYRAAMARDPGDVVACEKLGRLAAGALRDYHLAVFAYGEAARRTPDRRRQLGYRLLVAGIYRDQIGDTGRTIVEYRRILDGWPEAPNAAALRAELAALKAAHLGGESA